jgi:hypothetical protein
MDGVHNDDNIELLRALCYCVLILPWMSDYHLHPLYQSINQSRGSLLKLPCASDLGIHFGCE